MKRYLPAIAAAAIMMAGVAVYTNQPGEAAKSKHAIQGAAPDFTLKSAVDGHEVKLSDFKGKVRIVDFWATWCPPCRAEIPDFIALQKEYKAKGLEVIGVSVDRGGAQAVNDFAKQMGINYTSLLADDKVIADYGGIRGIPTTFVIDRDGNIVKKYVGQTPKETFIKDIEALF